MIQFDEGVTPGGRKISWLFLVLSGFIVGLAAAIMGVGGGFLTFPIFVYVLAFPRPPPWAPTSSRSSSPQAMRA